MYQITRSVFDHTCNSIINKSEALIYTMIETAVPPLNIEEDDKTVAMGTLFKERCDELKRNTLELAEIKKNGGNGIIARCLIARMRVLAEDIVRYECYLPKED